MVCLNLCKDYLNVVTKAVNFLLQSQILRNSTPVAKFCIMLRIAAIFANLGFWSRLRDDGSDTTRFRQPAAKFFSACRAFYVDKLNIILNVTHEFICENIPWFEDDIQAKTELRTCLSSAGDLRATPHPADF